MIRPKNVNIFYHNAPNRRMDHSKSVHGEKKEGEKWSKLQAGRVPPEFLERIIGAGFV